MKQEEPSASQGVAVPHVNRAQSISNESDASTLLAFASSPTTRVTSWRERNIDEVMALKSKLEQAEAALKAANDERDVLQTSLQKEKEGRARVDKLLEGLKLQQQQQPAANAAPGLEGLRSVSATVATVATVANATEQ